MWKKIFIAVGVVALILAIAAVYLSYRNRSLSPPGSAELTNGNLTVKVDYSRPSARDRVIFGSEEAGALQPYGVYWRLGANEATEISFSRDVLFLGQPVKAGRYYMYAVPDPVEFEVTLNSELGRWGYSEADHSKDVLTVKVPLQAVTDYTEQMTISLEPDDEGIMTVIEWATIKLIIPIE